MQELDYNAAKKLGMNAILLNRQVYVGKRHGCAHGFLHVIFFYRERFQRLAQVFAQLAI